MASAPTHRGIANSGGLNGWFKYQDRQTVTYLKPAKLNLACSNGHYMADS